MTIGNISVWAEIQGKITGDSNRIQIETVMQFTFERGFYIRQRKKFFIRNITGQTQKPTHTDAERVTFTDITVK